jgi:hypothetical protein
LAAGGGEGLGVQFIEFVKPLLWILNERFEEHSLGHSANTHAVSVETKLPRKPYGLASTVLEELGNIGLGHGEILKSPMLSIYQSYIPCKGKSYPIQDEPEGEV